METRRLPLRRNGTLAGMKGIDRIECARGVVWITASGSAEDVILGAGERRDFRGARGLCVQALTDAEIGLVSARRPRRRLQPPK